MATRNLAARISAFFAKQQKWILPACFYLSLAFTIGVIVLCRVRGFIGMETTYTFSLGADIIAMLLGTVLLYSCVKNKDGIGENTRTFILLITMTVSVLFSDACSWLVQGIPTLRVWNIVVNVVNYTNAAMLIFFFWRYTRTALELNGTFMQICNIVLNVLLIPTILACLVNFFYPLYFSVDSLGVYRRSALFGYSQIYLAVGLLIVIIGFFVSKVSIKERLTIASFIMIPVLNQLVTMYTFGLTTQYAAMMISIVLIYAVLFSERAQKYAATNRDLNTASAIQSGMLPNRFPAFPEHSEFDIHASMNPAKEVGGDFYDFFLIDDDHLGLVMADVSGKGVPAALFMMASKILLKIYASSGDAPETILRKVNDQVCSNNQLEMFVTVWFGVLDLNTGVITAVNAGHEYPVIRHPDGRFELLKDKHGFVVGGMAGVRYKQYEIPLEPGSKLFLYTDGVPEATNEENELFGTDRMLEALNSAADGTPREILESVNESVQAFVKEAPQFDDLTMLCVTYHGRKNTK